MSDRARGRVHGSTALRSSVRRFHVCLNAVKPLRMFDNPGTARGPLQSPFGPAQEQPEARLLSGSGRQAKLSAANRTRYRRRFPQPLRLWKDRTKGWVRGVTSFGDLGTRLESHFWHPCKAPLASGDLRIDPPPGPPPGGRLWPPALCRLGATATPIGGRSEPLCTTQR